MKLVSHKKAHILAIEQGKTVNVNGVEFRAGEQGPTAHNVTERTVALFEASSGFSVYHDDGTYSRPTGQARRLETVNVEEASNRLRAASDEAETEKRIVAMIQSGTLTPTVLDALMKAAPVVGAPAQSVSTVSGKARDFNVTTTAPAAPLAALVTPATAAPQQVGVTAQDPVQVASADTPAEPQPEVEHSQVDEIDEEIDYADPESILKLPRTELFGLARAFGVKVKASDKSTEIAHDIAEAFKESDEYKAAQAGHLPEQQPQPQTGE